MLPILLAGCLWVATQDDTRSFRELAEDQLQIQRALDRLEGTIEGLAKKLESQGRSHAVELLNAALAKLRARDEAERRGSIEERVAQIREELIGKRAIPAAEKQEALLRDLEDLLAILLDRKPIEKLDERLAAAREAAEEISKLRDEERQLAEETRQLAEGARSRDEEAMSKRIDDLLQRQRELDAKSREAERLSGALEAEQRVRDLEELLAMQKAAAAAIDRLGKGSSPVADKAAAAARAADAAEKAAAKAAAAKADAAAIQGLLEKAAELR
ncbi:MAG TPA: hypothetical protein VKE69_07590, partial [Planctomycetota bacterium]|nr:hypothetical protein [Planctomycetota bacterium]